MNSLATSQRLGILGFYYLKRPIKKEMNDFEDFPLVIHCLFKIVNTHCRTTCAQKGGGGGGGGCVFYVGGKGFNDLKTF